MKLYEFLMVGLMVILVVAMFAIVIPHAHADSIADNSHSQGDQFRCSTSPIQEIPCEMENILKYFFPQIISQDDSILKDLTKIISLQQQQIDNQNTEIGLLQKLLDKPISSPISQAPIKAELPASSCPVKMTPQGIKCQN